MWDIIVFLSNIFKRSACVCEKKTFLNMSILSINLKAVESALQFIQRERSDKSFFFLSLAHWVSSHIMLSTDTWLTTSQKILCSMWAINLLCTLHKVFRWLYKALVWDLSVCQQRWWAEFTAWYILFVHHRAALSDDFWRGTILLIISEVNWMMYNKYKLKSAII